jgi:hypothetical protein
MQHSTHHHTPNPTNHHHTHHTTRPPRADSTHIRGALDGPGRKQPPRRTTTTENRGINRDPRPGCLLRTQQCAEPQPPQQGSTPFPDCSQCSTQPHTPQPNPPRSGTAASTRCENLRRKEATHPVTNPREQNPKIVSPTSRCLPFPHGKAP